MLCSLYCNILDCDYECTWTEHGWEVLPKYNLANGFKPIKPYHVEIKYDQNKELDKEKSNNGL